MPKRTPAAILRRASVIVLVLLIVIAGLWLAGRAALLYTYGPNALPMAIDSRDVDQVEYLLRLGADPNKPDGAGMTPLAQVLSPRSGHDPKALEVMQLLLRFGADSNGTTSEGHPFLFEALTKRPPNISQALLDAGADPNIQLPDGESVLAYLIRNPYIRNLGNADRVRMLINAGAEVGPWEAILLGDLERLKRMIDRDSNLIHRPLLHGGTALHAAAYSANMEIARYLLDLGAQPNTQNDTGATPLHAALDPQYIIIHTPETRAEIAKILLEGGAQPNLADDNGDTPLHAAAKSGNAQAVMHLLDADADPLSANNQGYIPIALVNENRHFISRFNEHTFPWVDSILISLIEAGSPLDVEGPYRTRAIYVAARSATPETLELVIELGANSNEKAWNTPSALHYAHAENTRVLLEHGATVDILDGKGQTPLFWALTHDGDVVKVQLLLEAGADVYLKSYDGVFSVDAAKEIWGWRSNSYQVQRLMTHRTRTDAREAARLVLEAAGIDPAELE